MEKIKQSVEGVLKKITYFYGNNPRAFYGVVIAFFTILLITTVSVIIFMPPPAPTNIIADTPDFDVVRLRWDNNRSANLYRIYRTKDKYQGYNMINETVNLHYLDEALDPNTVYYYVITSVKNNRESVFSKEVQGVTGEISPPTNVRVEQDGNNFITIAWDGFARAERFTVYRADGVDRSRVSIGNTVAQNFIDEGLTPNTAYYYFVTQTIDGKETAHSSQLIATTRAWACGDDLYYDNDSYKTALYGDQCWFQENLRYETISGSWCYADDNKNCDLHGRLYDFNTLMNKNLEEGSQGLCPSGWRVPTDEDFREIERFIGMNRVESSHFEWRGEEEGIGDGMKIASACSQRGSDVCGSSNFQLAMGGQRSTAGAYRYITTHAFLWTSSVIDGQPVRRFFASDRNGVNRTVTSPDNGMYSRCVRNM